jgi:hypothetical protein
LLACYALQDAELFELLARATNNHWLARTIAASPFFTSSGYFTSFRLAGR